MSKPPIPTNPRTNPSYVCDVIGVGAPILDTLAQVTDAFLQQHVAGAKGGMELVDADAMAAILDRHDGNTIDSPGGSAGNTVFALARMGFRSALLGKLGSDAAAEAYRAAFVAAGGDASRFKRADAPNARCLSLITPDSQRTMRTMLGASALLGPGELSTEDFQGAAHCHIEGYLFFNPDLIHHVAACADQAGCGISVDLASFEVVGAARSFLPSLLERHVDIVFANEDEAAAYFPDLDDHEEMARRLAEVCEVAVVKLGAKGSLIASGGTLHRVDPRPVSAAVDTTGAGDLWASGFLSGWLRGMDLPTCGTFGSVMGAEVVQVVGAAVPEERWSDIRAALALKI